jgi:serine/threonine protein phosphatase PrpC
MKNGEGDEDALPTKETLMLDSKGCTANVMLIKNGKFYVANAGDSRCVMAVDGKAIDLSVDHKPELQSEIDRIHKAGSTIINGRVDGNLNLCRAIGDLKYKQNKALKYEEHPITCFPDVRVEEISVAKADFLVMACDGIWEGKSSQDVVDFVYKEMNEGETKLSKIVEKLLDEIVSPDYVATGKFHR